MGLNHAPFAVKLRGSGGEGKGGFTFISRYPSAIAWSALRVSSVGSARAGPTCVPQEHVLHQPFSTWCLVLISPCENIRALYREIWLLRPLKNATSKEGAVPSSLMQPGWLWFVPIFAWGEKVGKCGEASLSVYLEILFGSKLRSLSQQSLPDSSAFCCCCTPTFFSGVTCFHCKNVYDTSGPSARRRGHWGTCRGGWWWKGVTPPGAPGVKSLCPLLPASVKSIFKLLQLHQP